MRFLTTCGVILLALPLAAPAAAQGSVLLEDDFNDNWINPDFWWTETSAPGATVTEVNQRLELFGRGWLVTKEEFNPEDLSFVRVEGYWSFLGPTDEDTAAVSMRATPVNGGMANILGSN